MKSLSVSLCLSLVGLCATTGGAAQDGTEQPLIFECASVFGPETTEESLAAVFGEANVVSLDSIPVGEGLFEAGVVIFSDTEDRVDVTWRDPSSRYSSNRARIRGDRNSWETPHGLRLGLDLRSVEAINGRPFQLSGFAWDYAGTVLSWEGGRLEASPGAPCEVFVRLAPRDYSADAELGRAYSQVRGDRRFLSSHPSMQLLNPEIYALVIRWP